MSLYPEWRERAACKGRSDINWFPDATDLKGLARCQLVCSSCPVKDECADHAYVVGERFGVWAGVNVGMTTFLQERERKRGKKVPRSMPSRTLSDDERLWLEERYA